MPTQTSDRHSGVLYLSEGFLQIVLRELVLYKTIAHREQTGIE
jgi:hypothetical protein